MEVRADWGWVREGRSGFGEFMRFLVDGRGSGNVVFIEERFIVCFYLFCIVV